MIDLHSPLCQNGYFCSREVADTFSLNEHETLVMTKQEFRTKVVIDVQILLLHSFSPELKLDFVL